MLKPVEKPIKFIKNLSTKGKSYPITHISAVIDDDGESVKSTIDSLKNKSSMTEVTWLELKDKRNAGKLIPGTLYRITDYQCTTTQENTQSAGHQFDIVLLALSEHKLAEEGWAMMHENIYDVKFSDGRKKCYIAKDTYYSEEDEDEVRNIVDLETGLGVRAHIDYLEIDEENKKANYPFNIVCLSVEDLPYNYFQNSNLSAWKVWYCLDNDTARFAWADDSVDGEPLSVIVSGTFSGMYGEDIKCKRNPLKDATFEGVHYFNFDGNRPGPSVNIYTETLDITLETKWYEISFNSDNIPVLKRELNDVVVSSVIPSTEIPNGRGVIYRLIDEWNNDVPYDFKNIQFVRPMTDGAYDPEGEDTWVYTFTFVNENSIDDASILDYAEFNYINPFVDSGCYNFPFNVFISDEVMSYNKLDCFSINNTCVGINGTVMYGTSDNDNVEAGSIYIGDKKVLTES